MNKYSEKGNIWTGFKTSFSLIRIEMPFAIKKVLQNKASKSSVTMVPEVSVPFTIIIMREFELE